jgi:hypothetical protein
MKQLIDSVESSLNSENWYAALITTLTLPDIAGKIDYPITGSNKRYADWFDKYVGDKYKSKLGHPSVEHTFLSGNDCYALRCSFLHEGKSEITEQRAREVLDDFVFVVAPKGSLIHCNQSGKKLQLQIDAFCNDILDGLRQWIKDIEQDLMKQIALNALLEIQQIKFSNTIR